MCKAQHSLAAHILVHKYSTLKVSPMVQHHTTLSNSPLHQLRPRRSSRRRASLRQVLSLTCQALSGIIHHQRRRTSLPLWRNTRTVQTVPWIVVQTVPWIVLFTLKLINFSTSLSSCKQRFVKNYKRKHGSTVKIYSLFSREFLNLKSTSPYRLCPSPRLSAESTLRRS